VTLANIYTVSKLIKEFKKRSELFDDNLELGLEDLDVVFALDFLKVVAVVPYFSLFLCLFLASTYCHSATHMVVTWKSC
jgi:hypothetical protein